jgi:UPF0176 protein
MTENKFVVTSFYHFQDLSNYEALKIPMLEYCTSLNLKGTILLAKEGINATVSGSREAMDDLYEYLLSNINIKIKNFKESFAEFQPFLKMKVRLKKEIVALGVEDLDTPNLVGKYIKATDWSDFISAEDVVVIDTRNKYEIRLGSFKGAIDPGTKTFREFPTWVKENKEILEGKKIAMFCTGGVRCEKSTALMKHEGYTDVFHLEGGIIKYLEDTQNKSQAWHGDCFVFDDRVAVNDALKACEDLLCENCNIKLSTDDIRETAKIKKVICQDCYNQD